MLTQELATRVQVTRPVLGQHERVLNIIDLKLVSGQDAEQIVAAVRPYDVPRIVTQVEEVPLAPVPCHAAIHGRVVANTHMVPCGPSPGRWNGQCMHGDRATCVPGYSTYAPLVGGDRTHWMGNHANFARMHPATESDKRQILKHILIRLCGAPCTTQDVVDTMQHWHCP